MEYLYWHQTTVGRLPSILKNGLLSPKAAKEKGIVGYRREFKSSWNADKVSLMSNMDPRKTTAPCVSILVDANIKTISPRGLRQKDDIAHPHRKEKLVQDMILPSMFIGIVIGEVGYSFRLQKKVKPRPVSRKKIIEMVKNSGLEIPIYFKGEQIWPKK